MSDDSTTQHGGDVSYVCHTVISEVADAIDADPGDLRTPLYDAIDPDALERLFHRPDVNPQSPAGHVVFVYLGCEVTVYSNGDVHVSPPEHTTVYSPNDSDDRLRKLNRDVLHR